MATDYPSGMPQHLIQRGNNRQACFFAEQDYGVYLDWLDEYAQESGCAVHTYVLMTHHGHLLITFRTWSSARAATGFW